MRNPFNWLSIKDRIKFKNLLLPGGSSCIREVFVSVLTQSDVSRFVQLPVEIFWALATVLYHENIGCTLLFNHLMYYEHSSCSFYSACLSYFICHVILRSNCWDRLGSDVFSALLRSSLSVLWKLQLYTYLLTYINNCTLTDVPVREQWTREQKNLSCVCVNALNSINYETL